MTEQAYRGLELWPESMEAKQLFILLHGLGAGASDLVSLAEKLKDEFPAAGYFIPEATFPFDGGGNGRQWYSNAGINESNR
jgi:phospholipase/carboxylesterase